MDGKRPDEREGAKLGHRAARVGWVPLRDTITCTSQRCSVPEPETHAATLPSPLPAAVDRPRSGGSLCIYDATDRALAYVYFDTSERGANTERMTKDEARRIAFGIGKLPGLLGALG